MFEPELFEYLKADSGLNSLIAGRIYPLRLPDPHTLPAMTYQRISTVGRVAHDGALPDVESRFQFDIWSNRYGDGRSVFVALTNALLGFNAHMGDIQVSIPSQPRALDDYETETGLYRVMTEFMIWHTEGDGS